MCCDFLARSGALDKGLKVRPMALPDIFIDQDKPEKMYDTARLNAAQIVETALMALGNERDIAELRQLAPQPKLV